MPIGGGGGGGGPAAGSYLPVANKTGVTVDTTTYDDPVKGSGKLATLVFPDDRGALAIAISGDAFPRWIFASDAVDGLYGGNGTFDPYNSGAGIAFEAATLNVIQKRMTVLAAVNGGDVPRLNQLSPVGTISGSALPTVQLVTATGVQILTTRDAETVTPFTGDGTNNAATCAIAISPDSMTYSTVATISIAAALNLTGVLTDTVNARVPAGWYIKLTVSHGTLGLTTYY